MLLKVAILYSLWHFRLPTPVCMMAVFYHLKLQNLEIEYGYWSYGCHLGKDENDAGIY